ncbi:MAG: trigger factor [Planctomycetota bacterium]|nr:trigger factor [Planctomycetota bacterium]
MSNSATIDRPNKVSVQDAGPSRKKISIEIPAETVSEKLVGSVDLLVGQAALPGFRRGKAPRWLVEKQFGTAVKKEAKTELVSAAVSKAVQDLNLQVLGSYPTESLNKAELAAGKPFVFDVEVEVLPEFTLPELNGIAVKKPQISITDEMVAEELNKLCVNEGSLESRDAAEGNDYCTGHAIMKGKEGTEFYNLKGAVIQIPGADKGGKGMILGIMVDDFAKQVGSPKAGDTVTVKAKGPDNHEVEGIRNNDLTVTFKVERIDRIIAATGTQLAASMGFDDEAAVKHMIRERMEQRVQIQQQSVMHQQVAKHLLDNTPMELPERMTAQQAERTLQRRRLELMYRGVDLTKIEEHMAELRRSSNDAAARELKLFFILHKASNVLNVGVTEQEINYRIAQIAQQRGVRPDRLRAELMQNNQINGIYTQLGEHKTLDAIVSKATVTEMSADEFNKVMKDEAAKA